MKDIIILNKNEYLNEAEKNNKYNALEMLKGLANANELQNDYDIKDYEFNYENIQYEEYLYSSKDLQESTILAYITNLKRYFELYKTLNKRSLMEYKAIMIDNDTPPKTINIRINSINKYLKFLSEKYHNPAINKLSVKGVKEQKRNFIENVISKAEYDYFLSSLKNDKNWRWFFIIKFMACTGVRVSELVQIKFEHLKQGWVDIYGKGKKQRRIFIPKNLQKEFLNKFKNYSGSITFNSKKSIKKDNELIYVGSSITARGVAFQLKELARKYDINPDVVYPHSFRHFFAKQFLKKRCDLAMLADLMGHDSIETTRIYLRLTSGEMKDLVDEIVDW